MKRYCLLFLLFLITLFACQTQIRKIVSPNVNVASIAGNDYPYVEPYIVVNPTDKNNIIIGTIKVNPSNWESVAFVSHDNGFTWKEIALPIPDTMSYTADPYLVFNSEGNAYYIMLGDGPASLDMMLFRSETNGNTWEVMTAISPGPGKKLDHSTLSIDMSPDSPYHDFIYAAAFTYFRNEEGQELVAPFMAISSNAGSHFTKNIVSKPSPQNLNIGNAVITSDGTIFFFYFIFMDIFGNWLDKHILNVITSKDGGKTFSKPVSVSDKYTAYLPDAAVDLSYRFKDRVYVTYCYTGDDPGIYISYSDKSLEQWSRPIKVSDSSANTAIMSDIAVNKQGIVAVSWFDNRNDPSKNCYDIYFSYSTDGGNTFNEEIRVTEVSSCPTIEKSGGAAQRWKRGGDYHTLSTGPDGHFYIAWPDARDGLFQPFFSKIIVRDNE